MRSSLRFSRLFKMHINDAVIVRMTTHSAAAGQYQHSLLEAHEYSLLSSLSPASLMTTLLLGTNIDPSA